MLVMTRQRNESIIINDDVTIIVIEVRGDKVRLGVETPREFSIHRQEVYEILRENQKTKGDLEKKFQDYLDSGKYNEACSVLREGYVASTAQASKLVGLREKLADQNKQTPYQK